MKKFSQKLLKKLNKVKIKIDQEGIKALFDAQKRVQVTSKKEEMRLGRFTGKHFTPQYRLSDWSDTVFHSSLFQHLYDISGSFLLPSKGKQFLALVYPQAEITVTHFLLSNEAALEAAVNGDIVQYMSGLLGKPRKETKENIFEVLYRGAPHNSHVLFPTLGAFKKRLAAVQDDHVFTERGSYISLLDRPPRENVRANPNLQFIRFMRTHVHEQVLTAVKKIGIEDLVGVFYDGAIFEIDKTGQKIGHFIDAFREQDFGPIMNVRYAVGANLYQAMQGTNRILSDG